jgi:sarcosine oxidase subunit beta
MTTADVVIVGGGVIGASIAYHLSLRGVGRVIVLERDRLGSGSTGKNAGGIRLQFSTEVNVRLSQRALPRLEAFKDEMGVDPQFHQVGYLFLITAERDVAPFERSLALWHRLGVPVERLTAPEAQARFPELRVDDVRFATFCARDGYADPHSILQGYVARARERGVEFREGAEVTGIELQKGRVAAVRAAGDRIVCGTVIDAAGAWGRRIGAMAGLDLPVSPLRRHIFVTAPVPGLDHEFPLTIEFASGLYFHRESGGVLLGMADPNDGPSFDDSVNWDFLPTVVEHALARLPVLEHATVKTGWAGFYEDTPDRHPIVGPVDEVPGFISATGFSGHGLMHAPAAGEVIAQVVCGEPPSVDISALRSDRFAKGALVIEHNVI